MPGRLTTIASLRKRSLVPPSFLTDRKCFTSFFSSVPPCMRSYNIVTTLPLVTVYSNPTIQQPTSKNNHLNSNQGRSSLWSLVSTRPCSSLSSISVQRTSFPIQFVTKRFSSRSSTSVVFVSVNMTESSNTAEILHGKRVGFIGAGMMAEALARGWDKSGILSASRMFCTDVNVNRLQVFKEFGVTPCEDSKQVADQSDILFVAVKPYTVQSVLSNLRGNGSLHSRHLVVSIAAGVTLTNLQSWAGDDVKVVRVMPNTPCLVGQTAAAMSFGGNVTMRDADLVRNMFNSVGSIHTVDEKLLDAVTGLSGSGPAYVFVAIEALADGGVAAGLPRDVALSLAAQTVLGAAQMVVETGKHPGVLKDQVASPGGTTIAGLHELEKGGFRSLLMNAVLAAAKRSKEMSE